ncbi:MAG: hypothetical protein H7146_09555 [Burkholderiaceae bacterium]|nr:hypothetical protein [Microbacteriaceae bacterium]
MPHVLPTRSDLQELSGSRHPASVSIYLATSPLPAARDESRIALKTMVADVARTLHPQRSSDDVPELLHRLETLGDEGDLWGDSSRGIAVFASPGTLRVFRLVGDIRSQATVGDRFDIGTLLRAVAFDHSAHILALTEGSVHLYSLTNNDRLRELDLPDLPADLATTLEHLTTADQSAPPRALGANGDKTEQRRYCRIVHDAVLARIAQDPAGEVPLILAASVDLEPAFRAVNRHRGLAEQGVHANPESLTPAQLADRARAILHELHVAELTAWCERFELERSRDLATSDLGHVARAATAAAVGDLLFDMDSVLQGSIDDDGVLSLTDVSADGAADVASYRVVDEIAARVLRAGGTVRAARTDDLPEGSPVAAILRYAF